jgi:hypothetical protein
MMFFIERLGSILTIYLTTISLKNDFTPKKELAIPIPSKKD